MKQYKITQCNGWENTVELSGSHELIKKQYTLENKFNVYPVTSIIDLETNKEIFNIKEPKQHRIKTNKTAVLKALTYFNMKDLKGYEEIAQIKRLLRNTEVSDIERLQRVYIRLIDFIFLASTNYYSYSFVQILTPVIKEILNSNIDITDSIHYYDLMNWKEYGLI